MSPAGLKTAESVTSRDRTVVKPASINAWMKDPKRYIRYRHKAAKARYVIDPGGTKILPNGQVYHDPGLTVEFDRFEFILDRKDKEFDLIESRLKDSRDLGVRLFVVSAEKDDLPPAGFAGKNVRSLLNAGGVQDEAHLKRLIALAGKASPAQMKELEAKVVAKDEKIKELEAALKDKGSSK